MKDVMRSTRTLGRAVLFLAAVALAAALTHVAWSGALAGAIHAFYDHRIFNVRKIQSAYDFVPFAADFLRAKHEPGKPLIVIGGASLTFGPGLSDSVIFSRQVARRFPDATVLNLSVIGAEGHGMAAALACAIRLAGVTPDLVILELPVINDAVQVSRLRGQDRPLDQAVEAFVCPRERPSLFSYFLANPKGTTWVPIVRDDARGVTVDGGPAALEFKPDYVITPEAYERIAGDLRWLRNETLRDLAKVTKRLVAYPGPINIDGAVRMGVDRKNLEHQIADTLANCRTIPGVTCLDPGEFPGTASAFRDASHLNPAGHKSFGDWMVEQLRKHDKVERGHLTSELRAASHPADSRRGKLSQDLRS
jgi:hypothetical protein